MKEEHEQTNASFRSRQQSAGSSEPSATPGSATANGRSLNGHSSHNGAPRKSSFDVWTALDLLARRWPWVVVGSFISAGLFFLLGFYFIRPSYTASAQLLRYETPGATEFFQPMTAETFAALIRSPELLQKVGEQALPPIPGERLARQVKVEPEPDSDIVKLSLSANLPRTAVDLLNAFSTNAVEYVRGWYSKRAEAVSSNYLKEQVALMEKDIRALEQQLREMGLGPQTTGHLAQVSGALGALGTNLATASVNSPAVARQRERLDKAMGDLEELLTKYTEIHPSVIEKKGQIAFLEKQLAAAATNRTAIPAVASSAIAARTSAEVYNPEMDIVRTKLMSLQDGRVALANRQHEAELYARNPPGIVRVFAPATVAGTKGNMRRVKIGALTLFGGAVGLALSLSLIGLVELTDRRLRTAEDVRRVARLPLLSTLSDLHKMTPEARSQWAFRTWTMLQGRLSPSANHGLVCGITSCSAGEGRTTWIHLLAEAASLTGFRVLTIATRPSPSVPQVEDEEGTESAVQRQLNNGDVPMQPAKPHTNGANGSAITPSVLSAPGQVTEKLTGPNSQPMVHIPLPGWVWNLERRKQWGEALNQWRKIENLVILVELPPASVPEAVLLGSNLPNMLWLTESGKADAGETRTHLETLRNARCNLVGAVLNRDSGAAVRKLFPRWFGVVTALLLLGGVGQAQTASEEEAPDASRNTQGAATEEVTPGTGGSFSVVKPAQRAQWQQRLTLGPGDVLNFALYGSPDLVRADVAVGPDGRISFLEAADIVATGKTIDELRAAVDQALANYRRGPRTIITPVAFRSKKYYMLGKVMTKGVFTLDRPITVLEAIARAKGFENGLIDRNVVDLADFQHSFLVRGGKRIPLKFDRLFQGGDLSENIPIEPEDYIYIAPAEIQEVYVVGEVRLPGAVTYHEDTTIISALTARGGFTERAFRARVVVVRGPLNNPQLFPVDTHALVQGKGLNFKLQPKDIVYVNSRPFIRVEELADLAATAFIQSIITSWVGVDVVKPIQ